MAQPWSEERKQQARENLARARQKKLAMTQAEKKGTALPDPKVTKITKDESTEELLKRALEAIANLTANQQFGNNLNTTQAVNGKLVGSTDRFSVNPADYPDPTERLAEEPSLTRYGFKDNYELQWNFTTVSYQNKENIWLREPKMQLDLIVKVYDEDTGEATNGRYIRNRLILCEDPDTAIWMARERGIDVPEDPASERSFLTEMRYLQARDWLFGCLQPNKPQAVNQKQHMVVGGKVVEYFEVNGEETPTLKFNQLNSKL